MRCLGLGWPDCSRGRRNWFGCRFYSIGVFCCFVAVVGWQLCYNDDKKSIIVKFTENSDWEMTVLKNNGQKPVINGRPLFSLRNIVHESSGHKENLPNKLMTTRLWLLIMPCLDPVHKCCVQDSVYSFRHFHLFFNQKEEKWVTACKNIKNN